MTEHKGRVTDDKLGYNRDLDCSVREVTVAIPTDEFDSAGRQFDFREKVVVVSDPVEEAIQDVRGGE